MHATLEDMVRAKDRRSGLPAEETWARTTMANPLRAGLGPRLYQNRPLPMRFLIRLGDHLGREGQRHE